MEQEGGTGTQGNSSCRTYVFCTVDKCVCCCAPLRYFCDIAILWHDDGRIPTPPTGCQEAGFNLSVFLHCHIANRRMNSFHRTICFAWYILVRVFPAIQAGPFVCERTRRLNLGQSDKGFECRDGCRVDSKKC
jgi:hypothetical protein